jgi:hypothetical protein
VDNYYKKNFDGIISRCRQINSGAKSGALLHINSIREIDRGPGIPDVKPLNAWDFDSQLPEYFDALLDREEAVWSRRTDVEDDRIPSVTPFFRDKASTAPIWAEKCVLRKPQATIRRLSAAGPTRTK